MKTFEEKLRQSIEDQFIHARNSIGEVDAANMPIGWRIDRAVKSILAAHQAEMDRVVDEVIGEEASTEHLKSDTYTKQEVINIFNGLLRVQRARYKAIKDAKK